MSVRASSVAAKPSNLTFEQAAAVSVAAMTATATGSGEAIRYWSTERQVVWGTFAVQVAKALGARATGVCSTRNVDTVRSLGADHVIAYTREDFVHSPQHPIVDKVEGDRPTSGIFLISSGSPRRPPKRYTAERITSHTLQRRLSGAQPEFVLVAGEHVADTPAGPAVFGTKQKIASQEA